MTADLEKELIENGYFFLREIAGRGICGLLKMAFTTGLVYNLDEFSYEGRYCFHSTREANEALEKWNGTGDPAGNWIKHKGGVGEYRNPNYE